MIVYSWIENIMIYYFFSNQVDSSTNLFNDVLLKRVFVRPTKKVRSVGPHKLKSKTTTTTTKKSRLKNNKFRSVSMQLRERSTELDNDGTNIL